MQKHTILRNILLLAAILFISSCDNMTVTTGNGDEKVEGNGKLTSADRETGAFSSVDLEGVFNVFLIQGEKEGVKIETDENILPLVLTSVDNNKLSVKMKENTSISKMKKINVYITFVNISKITSEGVGMLNCSGHLNFRDLELDCKGVGATRLDLDAETLTIRSEIVGAMFLQGNVKQADIAHKGVGAIQAFDLKTEKMTLVSEGIGTAEVFASKELNVRSSGLGGVKYKGGPAVKNIRNEGIGKVVSAD